MFTFNRIYFIATGILLSIEVGIALFVQDAFVRPFLGDFLAVLLLYCFVKSFLRISYRNGALLSLMVAYLIEVLQYFKFVETIGLQDYRAASVVLGNQFDWVDMLMYTLAGVFILVVERFQKKTLNSFSPE